MTTREIAEKLVALCRRGEYDEAFELYANDAVSNEMSFVPNNRTKGKENIIAEHASWASKIVERHAAEVGDPLVAGNHFAVRMSYDMTFEDRGREQMEEICLYRVSGGKITEVSFYYDAPTPT